LHLQVLLDHHQYVFVVIYKKNAAICHIFSPGRNNDEWFGNATGSGDISRWLSHKQQGGAFDRSGTSAGSSRKGMPQSGKRLYGPMEQFIMDRT